MVEKQVTVKNIEGLHLRPAARIVQLVKNFNAKILLYHNDKRADAQSILEVMSLGAVKGGKITVVATGPDEDEALRGLFELFSDGAGI